MTYRLKMILILNDLLHLALSSLLVTLIWNLLVLMFVILITLSPFHIMTTILLELIAMQNLYQTRAIYLVQSTLLLLSLLFLTPHLPHFSLVTAHRSTRTRTHFIRHRMKASLPMFLPLLLEFLKNAIVDRGSRPLQKNRKAKNTGKMERKILLRKRKLNLLFPSFIRWLSRTVGIF